MHLKSSFIISYFLYVKIGILERYKIKDDLNDKGKLASPGSNKRTGGALQIPSVLVLH